MATAPPTDSPSLSAPPDLTARVGGWLFKRRSWLPLPIVLALLLAPPSSTPRWVRIIGVALVLAGEGVRLWGVRHIGVVSRTRSDRLGPLIASGPFGLVRNPLYLGNLALWLGFTLSARLPWLAPLILLLLAAQYHAIVRWEEQLLESRMGQPYRDYLAQVPRWLPRLHLPHAGRAPAAAHSWALTLFSERGTLIGIGVGYVLLGLKQLLIGR